MSGLHNIADRGIVGPRKYSRLAEKKLVKSAEKIKEFPSFSFVHAQYQTAVSALFEVGRKKLVKSAEKIFLISKLQFCTCAMSDSSLSTQKVRTL